MVFFVREVNYEMNKIALISVIVLFIAAVSLVAIQISGQNSKDKSFEMTQTQENMDAATAARQIGATDFASMIEKTGLNQQFSEGGPFTLFAPSNEAIGRLSQADRDRIGQDQSLQRQLIGNHIYQGTLTTQNISDPNLSTASGQKLVIEQLPDKSTTINGYRITGGIQFGNGVIYQIDGVMLPK